MNILGSSMKYLVLLFLSPSVFANMTSPSLFKDMMSSNPGTISGRTAATFSASARKDKIIIDQDLTGSSLGTGAVYEGVVNINNFRAFYGGKGGGLTSEILFEQGSGGRTDTFKGSSQEDTHDSETTVTNLNTSFGLWDGFGINITNVSVKDQSKFNTTINGQNLSADTEVDYSLLSYGLGFTVNFGLDFGAFYQKGDLKADINNGSQTMSSEQTLDRYGLGIGYNSKSFRTEVGYMRNVKSTDNGDGDVYPSMAEFTTEVSFGKLRLGYTGRYFMDGFFLFSGVIYDVLAYSSVSENRLENSINFALGDDSKGHSFSGSLSVSTVENEQAQRYLDGDENKYKTTTKSQMVSVSYSYVF